MNISTAGVHRKKASPDRLWFRRMMEKAGIDGQEALGKALGKELRCEPYSPALISRRLSGHILWTAEETQALARLFRVPVTEVMTAIGAAAPPPLTGSIDVTGSVTFSQDVPNPVQILRFDSNDGLAGATATIELVRSPVRGVLVVKANGHATLRQCIGQVGDETILSPLFGAPRTEHVKNIRWTARVRAIHFP